MLWWAAMGRGMSMAAAACRGCGGGREGKAALAPAEYLSSEEAGNSPFGALE